jgi:GNAT superfamily N-acetyltransferase
VTITLRHITADNTQAVQALRVTPDQERFVDSVTDSLAEALEYPHANPWFRAVYADDEPVGFVMLSWDVEPSPPEIIGPWFLWRLLIDQHHQRKGFGQEVMRQVMDLVRAQGATELSTSYVPGDGGPSGFYARLGFVPTGDLDAAGEIILRRAFDEQGPLSAGSRLPRLRPDIEAGLPKSFDEPCFGDTVKKLLGRRDVLLPSLAGAEPPGVAA